MVSKVERRKKAALADHLVYIALCVTSPSPHLHRSGKVLNSLPLPINSKVEQHLASKNHTRLASGLPGGKAGCFNAATGRWERTPPTDQEHQPAPAPTPSQPSTSLGSIVANEHNFYCQLCKVTSCHNVETFNVLCPIPLSASNPPIHAVHIK